MLQVKDSPVGIDRIIKMIQSKLYDKLLLPGTWGSVNYESYGRCYRNKKDTGYIAEVYTGNKEYKEVYWDDTKDAVSFFGMDPVENIDVTPKVGIHVVFFVNLDKLKPLLVGQRADEEVRLDVHEILKKGIAGAQLTKSSTGLENVLREYSGSYRDDRLKAVDMHPVHCFRFDLSVKYDPFKC